MSATAPPAGFVPWSHPSPMLDRLGGLWQHASEPGRFGFEVDDPKLNSRSLLHAGAISTIADVCLGHTLAASTSPPTRLLTANLNITFIGTGELGRWVDVVVVPQRVGRRMATAAVTFTDGDRVVAHATGLFIPAAPTAPAGSAASGSAGSAASGSAASGSAASGSAASGSAASGSAASGSAA